MTNSLGTNTRNILVDFPDWAGGTVYFYLVSQFAASGNEGFPQKEYSLLLSGSGTGTQVLPVPDNTGDASWLWRIKTPDNNNYAATLAYGSALQLTAWLASALSSETANSLADSFVLKDGDTMTGPLILDADPVDDLGAATKQYVDDSVGGGAEDVADLTTVGLTPGNYLQVDDPGGLVEITPAGVLSNIGAAAASDLTTHEALTTTAHGGVLPQDAVILSKSSGYELAAEDAGKIVECGGTFTITLPNGLDAGFQATIVNVGSGTITLAAATTLQGAGTMLATQYTGAVVYHRGSNIWLAMGRLT